MNGFHWAFATPKHFNHLRVSFRSTIFAIAAASAGYVISDANAFDESHVLKVVTLKVCSDCDLSDAYLEEQTLKDMELAGANLSGAHLAKSDFEFSNLKGANLRGADLSEARLNSVYLVSADLTNANLRKADLSGASFVLADLTGANLEEASGVTSADFTLAIFCKTVWLDGTTKNKDC